MAVPFILVRQLQKSQCKPRQMTRGQTKVKKFQAQGKAQNWMPPQIYSDIHCLPSTRLVDHDSKSSKISTGLQICQINYTQELMEHIPKIFQDINIYFKSGESSRWISYTYLFVSEIIIIFGSIFLHKISRLLKVDLKWLRVPRTDF